MATSRRRLQSVAKPAPKPDLVEYARDVIRTEAEAVAQLAGRLNGAFARAAEMVLACSGRVVVTGPPTGLKTACVESRKPNRSGHPW